MFAYIESIYTVGIVALLAVIGFLSCVQFSEFEEHRKKHMNDEGKSKELASKFAFVPYFLIPVIGAIVATFAGLAFTDYVIAHEYIADPDAVFFVAIASSIVIYGIVDLFLFSKIGDTVYFRFIEEKFLKLPDTVEEPAPEVTTEQELIILLNKLLKK